MVGTKYTYIYIYPDAQDLLAIVTMQISCAAIFPSPLNNDPQPLPHAPDPPLHHPLRHPQLGAHLVEAAKSVQEPEHRQSILHACALARAPADFLPRARRQTRRRRHRARARAANRVLVHAVHEALEYAECDQAAHVDAGEVSDVSEGPGFEGQALAQGGVEVDERRVGDGPLLIFLLIC